MGQLWRLGYRALHSLVETREKDIFVAVNTTVDLGMQCFIVLDSSEHGLTAVLFFRDLGL